MPTRPAIGTALRRPNTAAACATGQPLSNPLSHQDSTERGQARMLMDAQLGALGRRTRRTRPGGRVASGLHTACSRRMRRRRRPSWAPRANEAGIVRAGRLGAYRCRAQAECRAPEEQPSPCGPRHRCGPSLCPNDETRPTICGGSLGRTDFSSACALLRERRPSHPG
jgi:hypothetical protein